MKEYVFTIVGISLVCAFARMLSPENDEKGTQQYIKLLCGFLLLCAVIEPIVAAMSSLRNTENNVFDDILNLEVLLEEDYEKIYNGTLITYSEESVSEGLKEMLMSELRLGAEDIDVYVELVEAKDKFIAQRAVIELRGEGIFADPRDIEKYVNGTLGCECEIIYD